MANASCPDCGGELVRIRMVDSDGAGRRLWYAQMSARRRWSGAYPRAGYVVAYACDGCRRVFWYAVPQRKDEAPDTGRSNLPIPTTAPEMSADGLPIPADDPGVEDDVEE